MGSVVFTSSYSMSGYAYATYNVRVGYSESYNASTNKTTVRITSVELQKEGNGTNWGSLAFFGSVKVNGTTLLTMSGGSSVRVSLSGSGYCPVAIPSSSSTAIAHNDDGSKTVSFQLVGGFSYAGDSYFCAIYDSHPFGVKAQSKNVALTAHPRASAIASCPSAAETLQTITLAVSRCSAAFYHKASFLADGALLYTSEAFASALNLMIPRAWFASYPNTASLNVTVSVQTYSDASCTTAVGGAVTTTMSVTADAAMKPAVSAGWASLAPYNTGTAVAAAGITGCVKGYSRAQASFDASKIDLSDAVGASVASYSVACQGVVVSASPYLTGVLTSTSVSVVCTVTDTRGRTAGETFSLAVMDYAPPALSDPRIFRCGPAGTADEDGAYAGVEATALFHSLAGQNACTLTAAIAPSGGAYGAETALVSGTAAVLGPISPDASYSVRLTATDTLGNTAFYYASIPTRKWAMKFRPGGRGVAFGKAAETDDCFDIADGWAVKSRGIVDLVYPVGSLYLSVSAASPAVLFGGTWARIEDVFLLAAGTTHAAGSTGGEETHTLSIGEMPSHDHGLRTLAQSLAGGTAYSRFSSAGSAIDGVVGAAGGGGAHNNMPPYLAVYIWKRTA